MPTQVVLNPKGAQFETTLGTIFSISKAPENDLSTITIGYTDWVEGACATNEISYQGGQKTDIDVTSLCSTAQEVTNGLAAPAEVTLSRNWAPEDAMLAELEKAYTNNELRAYRVQFASGNGFKFLAQIRQNSWSVATAGKVSASYTLRLRGEAQRLATT